MCQFEKRCHGISLEILYGTLIDGSVPVVIGDFEFFGFDRGLGVDLFSADILAFTFNLDLALAVREEEDANV